MSKDSKIVLATVIVSSIALGVYTTYLFTRLAAFNILTTQNVNKAVQRAHTDLKTPLASVSTSPKVTPSPSVAVKRASSSARIRQNATPRATETPAPSATASPKE